MKLLISRSDFRVYKALKTVPKENDLVHSFLAAPKISTFIILRNSYKTAILENPVGAKEVLGEKCFNSFITNYNLCVSQN